MKMDEHAALLQNIRTALAGEKPDIASITAELTKLSEDYTQVTATTEKLENDYKKVEEENKTLLKSNMDLFLKIGVKPEPQNNPIDNKPKESAIDKLFNKEGELI
jgi:prefoldin subunit 5